MSDWRPSYMTSGSWSCTSSWRAEHRAAMFDATRSYFTKHVYLVTATQNRKPGDAGREVIRRARLSDLHVRGARSRDPRGRPRGDQRHLSATTCTPSSSPKTLKNL